MTADEILADLPYFGSLPADELGRLCEAAEVVDIPKGAVVIEEGGNPEALLVVAEGSFEATRSAGGTPVVLGIAGRGEVLGEMSLLEDRPASATLRALSPARVVRLPAKEFDRLTSHRELLQGMFLTVTRRLRERESALVHAEKLAALGTMTAGLLHEVNNPAAAIRRSAAGLIETADRLVETGDPLSLPALERARREEETATYLAGLGIDDAGGLAPSLVGQGWDPTTLAGEGDPGEQARLARLIHARQLAGEVADAATQLSELVGAVKSWVYLDQGEVQDVDLNGAVSLAASLLRHKLEGKQLDLDMADDLPSFEGRGVEISQVVTNLIDNAVDAAATTVEVRTRVEDGAIVCEVIDDGAGIPPEIIDKIWEPFFTTKEPGHGTGLGLALARRMIDAHQGHIEVDTKPGRTRFSLRIPIEPD